MFGIDGWAGGGKDTGMCRSSFRRHFASLFILISVSLTAGTLAAETLVTFPSFRKIQITDVFYAEGSTFGDFNNDGVQDIVSGPFWYEGPGFTRRHELDEPRVYDPLQYSNCFLMFTYDFDGDGWLDILSVGFPGQETVWYQNPQGEDRRWDKHLVHPAVGNESPAFADITGDGKPELIFNTNDHLGYAEFDPANPTAPWKFVPVSDQGQWGRFTHGLGYGDVNGDGRIDFLTHHGWWEQPEVLGEGPWELHPADFGAGAQIFVYDLSGDGIPEIIGSRKAHGWGLAWYEQRDGGFVQHTITGERHRDNRYGVRFSQPHALAMADIDGDGLQDIVTGKRVWAHGPDGDAEPNAPGVLYWFKTVRGPDGEVSFLPFLIDSASGVGTQVVAGDISGNGHPDIVVGNKNGLFVFLNEPVELAQEQWERVKPGVLLIHRNAE